MPVYEYMCSNCKKGYDVTCRVKDLPDRITCDSCGEGCYRMISLSSFRLGWSDNKFTQDDLLKHDGLNSEEETAA